MSETVDVWKEIDRSSAAGRALWRIYGGDPTGKAAGNKYSAVNRVREARRSPESPPSSPSQTGIPPSTASKSPQKAEVKVPKVGIRGNTSPSKNGVRRPQGKRNAEVILAELRTQQEAALAEPPPLPKGPCLDDKEKARLAQKMEYNGQEPAETSLLDMPMRARSREDRERQELENMFDDAVGHIQDCKARLAHCNDGRPKWELDPEAVQIKKQLARHVEDLHRIDRLLTGG